MYSFIHIRVTCTSSVPGQYLASFLPEPCRSFPRAICSILARRESTRIANREKRNPIFAMWRPACLASRGAEPCSPPPLYLPSRRAQRLSSRTLDFGEARPRTALSVACTDLDKSRSSNLQFRAAKFRQDRHHLGGTTLRATAL